MLPVSLAMAEEEKTRKSVSLLLRLVVHPFVAIVDGILGDDACCSCIALPRDCQQDKRRSMVKCCVGSRHDSP